jgi:hypothetical protein
MSRDEHNPRRAAIRSVLAYAATHPNDGLPYAQLPEVRTTFADRRELVLALQDDWSQALWARVQVLSRAPGARTRRGLPLTGAGDLAHRAWAECTARHPVLRRLLDTCRDDLDVALQRRERDMLTAAAFVA